MSPGVSGMRQRTRRPSVRVSLILTLWAASQSVFGSASATRRWWLRTTGSPAQRSMASSIMCQLYRINVRYRSTAGSVPPRAPDPAQARGLLVLPVPVAAVRPVGQPALLDARDARPLARARAARRPLAEDRRRRGRHRLLVGGHRPARRPGEPDAARPEP